MSEKTYKIGQAAKQLELKPYVLRYWETEFQQLRPVRTGKGQRLYTEDHIRLLERIRTLLHEEGMTIEGARRRLDSDDRLEDMKKSVAGELLAIRSLLTGDGSMPGDGRDAQGQAETTKPLPQESPPSEREALETTDGCDRAEPETMPAVDEPS